MLYVESRSDTGKLMDQFVMRFSAYRKKKTNPDHLLWTVIDPTSLSK